MATKRTEDMTVAETMDAIFGDGFAEQTFASEELEIARQHHEPVCKSPFVNAIDNRVFALSTMTTKDSGGRHFAKRYSEEVLADLEQAGLIGINRPVHPQTGFTYSEEHWSVEVTDAGQALVDLYPEHWDTSR